MLVWGRAHWLIDIDPAPLDALTSIPDALIRKIPAPHASGPSCCGRAALVDHAEWDAATWASEWRRSGRHEFALAWALIANDQAIRRVLMCVEGLTPDWRHDEHVISNMEILAPCLASAYDAKFLALERARHQQRRVSNALRAVHL